MPDTKAEFHFLNEEHGDMCLFLNSPKFHLRFGAWSLLAIHKIKIRDGDQWSIEVTIADLHTCSQSQRQKPILHKAAPPDAPQKSLCRQWLARRHFLVQAYLVGAAYCDAQPVSATLVTFS
jgi:hypothetical protein